VAVSASRLYWIYNSNAAVAGTTVSSTTRTFGGGGDSTTTTAWLNNIFAVLTTKALYHSMVVFVQYIVTYGFVRSSVLTFAFKCWLHAFASHHYSARNIENRPLYMMARWAPATIVHEILRNAGGGNVFAILVLVTTTIPMATVEPLDVQEIRLPIFGFSERVTDIVLDLLRRTVRSR
jgi:hypothetical protein